MRAAPPGAMMTAAYARLRNDGQRALRLTGASSPAFAEISLHRTIVEKGLSRMTHGTPLELASGQRAALEPGGWHLMLMRPAQAFKAGDRVPLSLTCGAQASEFTFTFKAPAE